MEFASKGVAGAGLGLGVAGTALGLMNGGLGNLLGGWNNGWGHNGWNNGGYICSDNMPVNRYELDLQQKNAGLESENALLKSNVYTDQKLTEVFAVLDGRIREMQQEQTRINTEQAVYNGVNTATIGCIRGQVDELLALTRRRVPNWAVCPGWGDVTVTPAAAEAAATTGA